ncbi:uncharacterized protein LOC129569697 isoform X2 [Sitodiplosis mosellana]|uniref:uncharacterized protein LOC129569697 isoform X2 n=1 Tax=Sitodiplosis mosellana TaxID=263140 RepID=UPI002444282A|nr:uncharacterized protein LOC129569697 isoform X2 [Sitodiplosis mosellana]
MFKASAAMFFSTILVAGCSAILSDFVKDFNFINIKNEVERYDFEYTLDNGKTFHGKAHKLNIPYSNIFLMIGDKDAIYWADLEFDELKMGESFPIAARAVQRDDDKLIFKNDFTQYEISLKTGELNLAPYRTSWNIDHICFTKAEKETLTFHYVKYNGTTENEADDAHVQIVRLTEYNQFKDVYRINFTDSELNCDDTFCKGISDTIESSSYDGWFIFPFMSQIDPNLLKSLTG